MHYGPLIGHIESQPFYDMPPPSALAGPKVEAHLRELGFGYRAKYLHQTAVIITQETPGWLDALRSPESPTFGSKPTTAGEMQPQGREGYRAAHESLLSLQGVGPKVADCVCLMGLGWGEAVPVDTHVWQIAQRDYKFGKGKHASLTKATYDAVGDHFRKLWGKEAGWAHSVLFTADLRAFSERLTAKIEEKPSATVLGSPDRVVQVKVELAPAIPDEASTAEEPTFKTETLLPMDNRDVDTGKITQDVKREIAEDAISKGLMVPADGRRRSKRPKRS
jgi:N-glycosylase/DNA lyase